MSALTVDEKGPGTILRDFETLVSFCRDRSLPVSKAHHLLPIKALPEINARLVAEYAEASRAEVIDALVHRMTVSKLTRNTCMLLVDRGRAEMLPAIARELKAMVESHFNHPSIVMWVPFNEGWGQHDTAQIVASIKEWDPTRLVNNASGWADRKVGDVIELYEVQEVART